MKTLTTTFSTVVVAPSTQPGYLVEVVFPSQTIRYSSRDLVTCMGVSWIAGRVSVSGISQDTVAGNSGQVNFGTDPDYPDTFVSFALSADYGFTDRPIRVWVYDQGAVVSGTLDDADALMIFDGVGDGATITDMEVSVTLSPLSTTNLSAPRVFINKANGFPYVQPKGTVIPWGSELFKLE